MEFKIEPLEKISAIGKKGGTDPFPILRHRGFYFYIEEEQVERLCGINGVFRSMSTPPEKPVEKVKVVGRGGIEGLRPFLLPGYEGFYVCVLAEHLWQLQKINSAYKELVERVREAWVKADEARSLEAPEYVPKLMLELENYLSEIDKALASAHYDGLLELALKAGELAESAKTETLKILPKGKYVYAVIPLLAENKSFGSIGMDGSEVYTMNYEDFTVVLSDCKVREYRETDENIAKHKNALQEFIKEYTVAPAAFGQVFKSEKILKLLLGKSRKAIKKALELIDGKIELGLKVIVSKEITLGEEERKNCIKDILNSLEGYTVKSIQGELFTSRLILNAAFLVERDKMEKFSEEVGKLMEKYNLLKFQYSGPWAPYNFVQIRIGGKR